MIGQAIAGEIFKKVLPIGIGLLFAGLILGSGFSARFKNREIKKMKDEWAQEQKEYERVQDSLSTVIERRTKFFEVLADSIIARDEKTEIRVDSLDALDFDEQIRHLSDRFNIRP